MIILWRKGYVVCSQLTRQMSVLVYESRLALERCERREMMNRVTDHGRGNVWWERERENNVHFTVYHISDLKVPKFYICTFMHSTLRHNRYTFSSNKKVKVYTNYKKNLTTYG